MKPTSSGYADVNGTKLYREIYGEGEPLVLIHGGLQGHVRTADTDRPMSFTTMGSEIAALVDHLRIPKADLVGHSFGGASAIRAAIQHPEEVRRLVVIS